MILLAVDDFKARGLSSFHCLLCLLKFVPKYKKKTLHVSLRCMVIANN